MDIGIKMLADVLVCDAEYLLKKCGLSVEHKVLEMIKTASYFIRNNATLETDESWVQWITSKELYVMLYIEELHKELARKSLSL